MNRKFKRLWLEALRSGEYTKGKKRLRAGNNFCVLGVAADLLTETSDYVWEGNTLIHKDENTGWEGVLPGPLGAQIKLSETQQARLIIINDETDTFDKAIKYIKEKL